MSYLDVIAEQWDCDDGGTTLLATVATPANDLDPNPVGHTYGLASLLTSGAGTSAKRGSGGAAGFFVSAGATSITDPANVFAVSGLFSQEADWPVTEGYFFYRNKAALVNYAVSAVRSTASTAFLKAYWDDGGSGGPISAVSTTAVLTSSTTLDIVVSYTGTEIMLWLGGVKVAVTNGTDALASTALDRMVVGMSGISGNQLSELRVDQIKLYSAPLTTLDAESIAAEAVLSDVAVTNPGVMTPFVNRLRANLDPTPVLVCGNSNANWINDPSNPGTNHGRLGGWYKALIALGYRWHGTTVLMPGHTPGAQASEVSQQHASLPWNVTRISSYGTDTGAPTAADAFWDINGSSSTETGTAALNYMMPFRYVYDNAAGTLGASTAWKTNGRVWPGAITIRSTAPISGHNLRATYYYAEGPYGVAPGEFNPTARQTADVKVGSVIDINAVAYDAVSTTLDLDATEYNSAADVFFNWGANGAGTVKGDIVTYGQRVESRDHAGGFEVGPLIYGGGMFVQQAKNALANISDAALVWYFTALFSNQTTPFALIDWTWGINCETNTTHAQMVSSTVAAITRIRAVAVAAGADAVNIPAILSNDQPVRQSTNGVEEAYVREVHRDMLEAATTLGNCVVLARHAINDHAAYIANNWHYAADTLNHHLTVPDGYDGEMLSILQAMGVAAGGGFLSARRNLGMGMGMGIG